MSDLIWLFISAEFVQYIADSMLVWMLFAAVLKAAVNKAGNRRSSRS